MNKLILAKKNKLPYHQEVLPQPKTQQKKKKNYRRSRLMVIGLVVLLFIFSLYVVSCYIQVAVLGYNIVRTERELEELQTEINRLELDIEKLRSLERIENIALNELNMKKPEGAIFVRDRQ